MAPYHSTYIDQDLWPEILKRVTDLKSLCRFRCVCKSWNSLLFSYNSIHQLTSNSAAAADKSYLLLNGWDQHGCSNPATVYRPRAPPNRATTHLDFPFKAHDGSRRFTVIGVVHGLVCLTDNQWLCRSQYGNFGSVFLWMPLSNKYIGIPRSNLEIMFDGHRGTVLGFGHDVSKNDFKVVRFVDSRYFMLEVFSVQDRLWRRLGFDHRLAPEFGSISFFMNGRIHWISRRFRGSRVTTIDFCLLVFDCQKEKLTTMEAPPDFTNRYVSSMRVLRYHGKLALLKYTVRGLFESLELWAMAEYGVESTWTKQIHLNQIRIEYAWKMQPAVMFMDDEVLRKPVDHDDDHGEFMCSCIAESEPPLNGLALEESVFATDPRLGASSYEKKEDEDGRVFYVDNGEACDYIIPAPPVIVSDDAPQLGCAAVLIDRLTKLMIKKRSISIEHVEDFRRLRKYKLIN